MKKLYPFFFSLSFMIISTGSIRLNFFKSGIYRLNIHILRFAKYLLSLSIGTYVKRNALKFSGNSFAVHCIIRLSS